MLDTPHLCSIRESQDSFAHGILCRAHPVHEEKTFSFGHSNYLKLLSLFRLIKADASFSHLLSGLSYWDPKGALHQSSSTSPCLLSHCRASSYPQILWGLKMESNNTMTYCLSPSWQILRLHRKQDPWRLVKNSLGRTAGKAENLHLAVWIHITPWHLSQLDVNFNGRGWACEFPIHTSNNAL